MERTEIRQHGSCQQYTRCVHRFDGTRGGLIRVLIAERPLATAERADLINVMSGLVLFTAKSRGSCE